MGGVEAQDVNSGSDAGVVHIQGCHLTLTLLVVR